MPDPKSVLFYRGTPVAVVVVPEITGTVDYRFDLEPDNDALRIFESHIDPARFTERVGAWHAEGRASRKIAAPRAWYPKADGGVLIGAVEDEFANHAAGVAGVQDVWAAGPRAALSYLVNGPFGTDPMLLRAVGENNHVVDKFCRLMLPERSSENPTYVGRTAEHPNHTSTLMSGPLYIDTLPGQRAEGIVSADHVSRVVLSTDIGIAPHDQQRLVIPRNGRFVSWGMMSSPYDGGPMLSGLVQLDMSADEIRESISHAENSGKFKNGIRDIDAANLDELVGLMSNNGVTWTTWAIPGIYVLTRELHGERGLERMKSEAGLEIVPAERALEMTPVTQLGLS